MRPLVQLSPILGEDDHLDATSALLWVARLASHLGAPQEDQLRWLRAEVRSNAGTRRRVSSRAGTLWPARNAGPGVARNPGSSRSGTEKDPWHLGLFVVGDL